MSAEKMLKICELADNFHLTRFSGTLIAMNALLQIRSSFPLDDFPLLSDHISWGGIAFAFAIIAMFGLGVLAMLYVLGPLFARLAIWTERFIKKEFWVRGLSLVVAFMSIYGIALAAMWGVSAAEFARVQAWKATTAAFADVLSEKVNIKSITSDHGRVAVARTKTVGSFQGVPVVEDLPTLRIPTSLLNEIDGKVFKPRGLALALQ